MKFEYIPQGVCSRHYTIEIEDDVIRSIVIEGGCNGNLKGIRNLITGMHLDDVIKAFDGVDCSGRGTSCPDQIARALKAYKESH